MEQEVERMEAEAVLALCAEEVAVPVGLDCKQGQVFDPLLMEGY